MPLTTPILGLPYADPDDFATDYPVEVDGPRTLALDELLAPVSGTARKGTDITGVPSGGWQLNFDELADAVGGVTLANGALTVPRNGKYRVTAGIEIGGVSDNETTAVVTVAGAEHTRIGRLSGVTHGSVVFNGTTIVDITDTAAQPIALTVIKNTTGATITVKSTFLRVERIP